VAAAAGALSSAAQGSAAQASVLALDPHDAGVPVLWDGGVAWLDEQGVWAATPGAAMRKLVSFKALGYPHRFALDAGVESAAGASASGPLAYGWEEFNEQTPPMGPGDQNVPAPALPYETSIVHRGVVASDGQVTALPCGSESEGAPLDYGVSLSGSSVAYDCEGVPPGAKLEREVQPSYILLGDLPTPGTSPRTIDTVGGHFQVSGDYVAYVLNEGYASEHLVVEDRATSTVSYELPKALVENLRTLALGADGTLVLVGAEADTGCADGASTTVWLSPSSPVAHKLGCFFDGSLRPVAGAWVGLAPGPGAEASLELVTIASGSARTLATFANPGVFAPAEQVQPADFDGQQLAWTMATCAGTAVEYTPEVSAMAPGPPASAQCPVRFLTHGVLHANAKGVFHVEISCPLGCPLVEPSIAKPAAIAAEGGDFVLSGSSTSTTASFRLSRRQLRYLRRHRRVHATLVALSVGLGSARESKYATRVTLAG